MFNLLLRGSEHLNCAETDHVESEALVLSDAAGVWSNFRMFFFHWHIKEAH